MQVRKAHGNGPAFACGEAGRSAKRDAELFDLSVEPQAALDVTGPRLRSRGLNAVESLAGIVSQVSRYCRISIDCFVSNSFRLVKSLRNPAEFPEKIGTIGPLTTPK